MKLDILMKLIALANNNPNDNEANLAARKACKAIIEHKFVITGGTVVPPKTTTPPPNPSRPNPSRPQYSDPFTYYTYTDPFEEFFGRSYRERAKAEKEKRAEEKQKQYEGYQKYKPKSDELKEREHSWQYEYYVAATAQFYNPLTRKHYNKMFQDLWFQETGTRHVSDTAAFRAGANYGRPEGEGTQQKSNPYNKTGHKDDEKYYQRRRERGFGNEDRKLRCKVCGNVFNTKFVGAPEAYVCNECTWTAYEKDKKPPKAEQKYGTVCHMTGKTCNTPVTCAGMGCQFSKR